MNKNSIIKITIVSVLALGFFILHPTETHAIVCGFGTDIGGGVCRGYLTTADSSPWTVPADWNNANNTIEVIGGGGAGDGGTNSNKGGGGGAYAIVSNKTLSGTVAFVVGTGGTGGSGNGGNGGDTYFNGASCAGSWVCGDGGLGGTGTSGAGTGGTTGNSVGTTTAAGGNGGNGGGTTTDTGGGGGGAGGPNGTGAVGGAGDATGSGQDGGGGGGGASGGDAGANGSANGGAGGANFANSDGGTGGGGTGGSGANGSDGSAGSGGGGGDSSGTTGGGFNGGQGGAGTEWDATHGAGGGGGGAGNTNTSGGRTGGAGGLYGGGGGGGLTGGSGGAGLIVITYTPAVAPEAPTVLSNGATNIKDTTATLSGTITDVGSGSVTVRGFAWGTNSGLSGGDTATTTDNGTFSESDFTHNLTSLTAGATYYVRAYATNGDGTGLGSIVSFKTGPQSAGFLSKINMPPNFLSMNSGLVGYWTFDGKNMTSNVADVSGSGNNGALSHSGSGTTTAPGKIGQALSFDGSDDFVNLGTPSNLNLQSNITISSWVKFDDVTDGTFGISIFAECVSGGFGTLDLKVGQTDGEVNLVWNDQTAVTSSSDLEIGQWYHITATREGSSGDWDASIYINGALDETANVSFNPTSQSSASIGRCGADNSQYFDGVIDELRVYNRALSSAEIANLYRSGSSRIGITTTVDSNSSILNGGLVGHWTFDGKNMIGNVADVSGNGNHGLITGQSSTTTAPGKIGQALLFDGTDDFVSGGGGGSGSISVSNLTAGVGTNVTQDTASVSPTSGRVMYLTIGISFASGFPADAVSISGTGATWTQLSTITYANRRRGWIYRGTGGSGSGAITIDYVGGGVLQEVAWVLDEVSGLDPTTPDSDVVTDVIPTPSPTTSITVTTSGSPATGDYTYSSLQLESDIAVTLEGGWTQGGLTSGGSLGVRKIVSAYSTTHDTSMTWSWTGDNGALAHVLILKPDTSGGSTLDIGSVNTVSFWAKPNSTTQSIIDLDGTSNIGIDGGTLEANNFSSPTIYIDGVATDTFPDTDWHHVVVTTATPIDADEFVIGRVSSSYYGGLLDDVRAYSRVLTASEVARLYSSSRVRVRQ